MFRVLISSVVLSLFIFLSTIERVEAAHLHAILIGDTNSNIKHQVMADLEQMQDGVRIIGQSINYTVNVKVMTENNVTKAKIIDAFAQLKVAKDDLLFFYFTGHGFRFPEKGTSWPSLYFNSDKRYLDLDDIIKKIRLKQPRFALVIADCCNVTHQDYQRMKKNKQIYFSEGDRSQMNCDLKKLFLTSSGLLVISGSSPGEFSWATDFGGVFTVAFVDSFSIPTKQPMKSWHDLMHQITSRIKGIQTPQYHFFEAQRGGV